MPFGGISVEIAPAVDDRTSASRMGCLLALEGSVRPVNLAGNVGEPSNVFPVDAKWEPNWPDQPPAAFA
jgi:hypothetical protein